MLQYLRHKRAPISRWMLTLLGVLWLGLVVQTCAMAEAQSDGAADCCCEESGPGCDWGYAPFAEDPCPAMQAATSDRHSQGLPLAERAPIDSAPAFNRILYPPVDLWYMATRLAASDTPPSHPALRFRVLLI